MTRPNHPDEPPPDRSHDPDGSSLLAAPRRTFLGAGAAVAGLFGLENFASDNALASGSDDPSSRSGSDSGDTKVAYTSVLAAAVRTEFSGVAHLENGRAVVDLPDHFGRITSETADLIVQVTPYGGGQPTVTERSPGRIVVEDSDGEQGYEFAFTVKGIRDGYENRPVIQERPDVPAPRGSDPPADESEARSQPDQTIRRHDADDPPKPPNPRDRRDGQDGEEDDED